MAKTVKSTLMVVGLFLLIGLLSVHLRRMAQRSGDGGQGVEDGGKQVVNRGPRPDNKPKPLPPEPSNNVEVKPPAPFPLVESPPEVQAQISALLEELRKLLKNKAAWSTADEAAYTEALAKLKQAGSGGFAQMKEMLLNKAEDLQLRIALIQTIAEMKTREAMLFLLDLFVTPSHDGVIRSYALESTLGHFKDGLIFENIQFVFNADKNYPGRYNLVLAMARTQDERAKSTLLRVLESDSDREARYHAPQGLRPFIGDASVREKLQYYALNDPDPTLRKTSILALGRTKDEATRTFLKQAFEQERAKEVKRAIQALYKQTFGEEIR